MALKTNYNHLGKFVCSVERWTCNWKVAGSYQIIEGLCVGLIILFLRLLSLYFVKYKAKAPSEPLNILVLSICLSLSELQDGSSRLLSLSFGKYKSKALSHR